MKKSNLINLKLFKRIKPTICEIFRKKNLHFHYKRISPSPLPNPNTHIKNKITFAQRLQGVPKVRSSNFLHYNFWLDQNFISRRCLLLYRVHVFRISVTFMTFCSCCSMECDTAGHRWSILSFFITWCARQISTPKQYLSRLGIWKTYILGFHREKIIILAPLHSKATVLLQKFETSWALLGRLCRGFFFAISGASNFKHLLFMTLSGSGLLTMCELPVRVSYFVSSLI